MCKIGNEILIAEIYHQIKIPRRALQLIVKGKRLRKCLRQDGLVKCWKALRREDKWTESKRKD